MFLGIMFLVLALLCVSGMFGFFAAMGTGRVFDLRAFFAALGFILALLVVLALVVVGLALLTGQ